MENGLSSLLDVAASLFLFALATQCVLGWIFALLFLSFLRASGERHDFRTWTLAWFARAFALSVILVRFSVPLLRGSDPQILNGTLQSEGLYALYQGAKVLAIWWLFEGVLAFAGRPPPARVRRLLPLFLALVAVASTALLENVEELLLVQSPLVIGTSLWGALVLVRLPRARRCAGTRITSAALLAQAGLWVLYTIAFADRNHGPWPLVRTPWTILAAHNSYFDLAVDVLVAAGLTVLLLQDTHRRQLEAEAERARLQAELLRGERLRSLGTLVSGVAHELNNPLTSILGYAEVLAAPGGEREHSRAAVVIREQALRCRRIVRGLAAFGGRGSDVLERLDFRALLERVVRGFELQLDQGGVRVVIEAPDAAPGLLGDRFALEQVVTNLLANAVQASPADGRVTLALTSTVEALELRVEDEGPGFSEDVLPHVFDPFFTTSAPGRGTGLGLAIVHGVVQAHDGTVQAENREAGGARLIVRLPVRQPRAPAPTPAELPTREIEPRPRPTPLARELELLVIEDEEQLCEMFVSLGRRRGWLVTSATNGAEGLARLQAGRARYDVVLCDLRMAAPDGIEIHDRLLREDPGLLERFLFLTGDLGSEEVAAFARRCTRPIVRKPFDLAALCAAIEELGTARFVSS